MSAPSAPVAGSVVAAVYLRKSNDEGDKAAEVKSIAVQKALAVEFAAKHGWTLDDRFIFQDDGISGAEFEKRPGLSALLAALEPAPVFKALIVAEQSRLGRETLDTLLVVRQIERAGVEIWSTNDGRQITLANDAGEIMAMLDSWRDTSERRKTITRVRNASFNRHENGFVPGGKTFGYTNARLAGTGKQPVRRVIDEAEAGVVRRIFDERAAGHGLKTIANRLNIQSVRAPQRMSEDVIAKRLAAGESVPNGKWSATSVREILRRETYRGVAVHGQVRKERRRGKPVRVRVPESEWHRREAPELRIVTEDVWQAAHAAGAAINEKLLRDGNKFVGKAENLQAAKYLLSGHLACGSPKDDSLCSAPLIAVRRGRHQVAGYVCKARHANGASVCTNASAVPMDELHSAVVTSLRQTFTAEKLEEHLQSLAENDMARSERQAERAALLARIPVLDGEATRLADAIAAGHGSMDTLLAGIKARQDERQAAETRVAEIEGLERDLRADGEAIERLRKILPDWMAALGADPVLARQVLRKVLPVRIYVRPHGHGRDVYWTYAGVGAFDGVLHGTVSRHEVTSWFANYRTREAALRGLAEALGLADEVLPVPAASARAWREAPAPISGGSDADAQGQEFNSVLDPSRPPISKRRNRWSSPS